MKIFRCCPFVAPALLVLCLVSTTMAQEPITVSDLIGASVEQIDDRYRGVGDAIVLFQRGNGPAALALLRETKKQHPELPPGEVLFAHLCFASGNPKPGRDILQVAAVTFKDDPEVWNMLADLQLREGHLAESGLLFHKAINVAEAYRANPRRRERQLSSAFAGAAMSNERRGLWTEAEPYLRAWLKQSPENAEIHSRLTTVLINTERYEEATQLLEGLRQLHPNQLPAEAVLAATFERLGKTEQAKASMQTALQKYPKDFGTQVAAARLALSMGDFDQALACAAAASALDESSFVPKLIAAQVDYLRGDFVKAEQAFQQVYQAKPGNQDAINGLASAILAQNQESKYKLALEYAEIIAKSNNDLRTPSGRHAGSLLAWALFHNGRIEDADRLITGILTSGPVSSETAYFAAVIYAKQGKIPLAQEALDKALSSNSPFAYLTRAEQLKKSLDSSTPATK